MNSNDKPMLLLLGASAERVAGLQRGLGDRAELHAERAYEQAVLFVQRLQPRVAIVDIAVDLEPALRALEDLRRASPSLPLIALADRKDPEVILRAMRAGAREFVTYGEERELSRVVTHLFSRAAAERPPGTIISFFPSNGGIGATTVATNVAGALLEGNRKVVLVDLDLQLGDVLAFLDLAARFTPLDVMANIQRLDRDLLLSSLAKHSSGLQVLAQTDRIEEADQVKPDQLPALLRFLARHFDFVVVDGLRGFDEGTVAALDTSDRLFLLLAQNVPSVKNAHRSLDVFRRLGIGEGRISVVVNRYLKSERVDLQSITENLGLAVGGTVANDYPTVIAAINKGVLLSELAPRSKVAGDIRRLALTLTGQDQKKSGGLLRSLFGGKESAKQPQGGAPVGGTKDESGRKTEATR